MEVVLSVPRVITTGFLFAIGFWGARKLTNKIDEKLILWNEETMKKIMDQL